jgi:hypothetical protein
VISAPLARPSCSPARTPELGDVGAPGAEPTPSEMRAALQAAPHLEAALATLTDASG